MSLLGGGAAYGPIFQEVDVPAGRSIASFTFTPPHAALALLACALGLVCLVLAWGAPRRIRRLARRRRRGPPGPDDSAAPVSAARPTTP